MTHRDDLLANLVETVRASPKYRRVSEDLIRRIGARELEKRRSLKEALAATRAELQLVNSGTATSSAARRPVAGPRRMVILRSRVAAKRDSTAKRGRSSDAHDAAPTPGRPQPAGRPGGRSCC